MGRASAAFLAGFVAAASLNAIAIAIAASPSGAGPTDPAVFWLFAGSLALCVGLGVLLARRILKVSRAKDRAETGARLHLRFVGLFSAAAVAPAVIVALFLGALLSRGVEEWFSDRLKTTIDNAAAFAKSYVDAATDDIRGEVLAMSMDLNQAVGGFSADRDGYSKYLLSQAVLRSFPAAYVIDSGGAVLVSAESASAPAFAAPSGAAFAAADRGDVSMAAFQDKDLFRALYKLSAYEDAYLYVARFAEPGILARLREAEQAVNAYREAERRRARLQTAFALAYLTTALLVLMGAVWLALATAARLSGPIGRLAVAAGRVAAGDLTVTVDASGDKDELDALGRAFNRMTMQLQAQRADLVSARHDAEARSSFIGAVLGGVSAGVIGLRDGAITAANPGAATLLGAPASDLDGRRLLDVAPEFAEALKPENTLGGATRVDLVRAGGTTHLMVRRTDVADGAIVLTFDDVTELISAQRHEAWKDVARRIAHEIKNPLTPIQLAADRIRRKFGKDVIADKETFDRCVETILRQVADIGRMVDEFSSFARMPAPRFEPVDVSALVREIVFAQRLTLEDITVQIENDARPEIVLCDERLLGQALTNVLKNAGEAIAAKRARDGAPKVGSIQVRILPHADTLAIEIIDDGVGLPLDRMRLLEPYVTTRAKGAGLGLAIVRRVVEDHGGAIELEDAPAPVAGALVRLILPRMQEARGALASVKQEVA